MKVYNFGVQVILSNDGEAWYAHSPSIQLTGYGDTEIDAMHDFEEEFKKHFLKEEKETGRVFVAIPLTAKEA